MHENQTEQMISDNARGESDPQWEERGARHGEGGGEREVPVVCARLLLSSFGVSALPIVPASIVDYMRRLD